MFTKACLRLYSNSLHLTEQNALPNVRYLGTVSLTQF